MRFRLLLIFVCFTCVTLHCYVRIRFYGYLLSDRWWRQHGESDQRNTGHQRPVVGMAAERPIPTRLGHTVGGQYPDTFHNHQGRRHREGPTAVRS